MTSFRTALLAVVAACGLVSSAPAQNSLKIVLPTQRMLAPHGLERVWLNQATMNPSRDRIRHLTADEDVVIVQSRSGVTTVFDAENGKKLWAVRVGRPDAASFAAATNDDLVLIVIGTEVYAMEKFSGKVAWRFDLPAAPSTSPAVDDDQVYVGTRNGSIYAFDLRKIRKFYDENLLPQWSAQTLQWRYAAFKEVTTPPVSTGRVVNFASRGGSLYSVTTHDRKLVFQFETDNPISAPMGESKRFLYLPSEDFKLYCINIENGRTRWTYNTGLAIRKQPKVVGSNVFVTPSNGGFHTISASLGKRLWWKARITGFVAASPTRVYATDHFKNLIVLNRESGATITSFPLRHFSVRIGNTRTDRIFIAKPSGLVVCIRETGREFPIYHRYPERRPIMPEFAIDPPAPKKPAPGN